MNYSWYRKYFATNGILLSHIIHTILSNCKRNVIYDISNGILFYYIQFHHLALSQLHDLFSYIRTHGTNDILTQQASYPFLQQVYNVCYQLRIVSLIQSSYSQKRFAVYLSSSKSILSIQTILIMENLVN